MLFFDIFRRNSYLKYLIPSAFFLASAEIYYKACRVVSVGLTYSVPHRLSFLMIGFDIASVLYIAFRMWRPRQTNTPEIKDDYKEIVRMRKIYIRIMTVCPFMMFASFLTSRLICYLMMSVIPAIYILSSSVFVKYFGDTILGEDGVEELELPDVAFWSILGLTALSVVNSNIVLDGWSISLLFTVLGIAIYIFIINKSSIEKAGAAWIFFAMIFLVMGISFTIGIRKQYRYLFRFRFLL